MRLVANKTGGEAVLHIIGTETITIAGASGVSNVATASETVIGATITQIVWGTDGTAGSHWNIKRGANTVAILNNSGEMDFAGSGMSQKLDPTATLVATLVGSANGYLMVEMQKNSTITNDPYHVG